MSIPRLYFSSLASGQPIFLDLVSHWMQIAHLSWSRSWSRLHSAALKFWQLLGQSGEGQTSGRACRLSPPPSLRWHKSIQIRSTPGTQPKRAQHTRRTNKQLQQNELTTSFHLDNSEKKNLPATQKCICAFSSTGISELLLEKIILQLITNIKHISLRKYNPQCCWKASMYDFYFSQNYFSTRFLNKCGRFAQISVITVERVAVEWQEKP